VELDPLEGCSVVGNLANEYHTAINRYRKNRGLESVASNQGVLSQVAEARLEEMVKKGYRGVINYHQQDIATELRARGEPCSSAAIVIFQGCPDTLAEMPRDVLSEHLDLSAWTVLHKPDWDDLGCASRYVETSQVGGKKGYYLQVVVFRKKAGGTAP
jgi:hypothetical protein